VDKIEFRLMRGSGAFRRMIVSHQREHAAVLRAAGAIGVTEDVAGSIDARTFAVPHAEHAVVFTFAVQFRLLRAPKRGRGHVFIDGGGEQNVVALEQRTGTLELIVEPSQWRAAITSHVAG